MEPFFVGDIQTTRIENEAISQNSNETSTSDEMTGEEDDNNMKRKSTVNGPSKIVRSV